MPESSRLKASTSSFVLSATIAVLANTALACLKDAYAPLKAFMKSLTGHDWTTQGLFDLFLFVGLGFLFANTGLVPGMDTNHLTRLLTAAVVIAAAGLAVWYAFF